MKRILLIAIVSISISQLKATNPLVEEKCCDVVTRADIFDLSYDKEIYSKHMAPAVYNESSNSLDFESYQDIKFIEIRDAEGHLMYKLPVMSKKARINKNLFEKGDYKLSFDLGNTDATLVTWVSVNS